MCDDEYDVVLISCTKCGELIETRWTKCSAALLPGDYILIADWIYHKECWKDPEGNIEPPALDDIGDW